MNRSSKTPKKKWGKKKIKLSENIAKKRMKTMKNSLKRGKHCDYSTVLLLLYV